MAATNGTHQEAPNQVVACEKERKRVVVCGAGVIGACAAYYLAKTGVDVTVVEKCGVACAASGRAGGFLALDWSAGPAGELARVSFRLHEQLAAELDADYGYRKVNTLSVSLKEPRPSVAAKPSAAGLPGWIDGPVCGGNVIGTPVTTAQVHPGLFTRAVLDAAVRKHGACLRIGTVEEVTTAPPSRGGGGGAPGGAAGGAVTGVVVDGEPVPAEAVVIAMGPWSSRIPLLGSLTHISGLKGNSVVLRPRTARSVSADMLFLQYTSARGETFDPEVFPRPNGEVYICGLSSYEPVPDDPGAVAPTDGAPAALRQVAAALSRQLAGAELVAEQACFRPCSEDGAPVIGPIPGVAGAYVATGHSCWGILNGPATGAALAELIVGDHCTSVDLAAFDPKRFLAGAHARSKWRQPVVHREATSLDSVFSVT